MQTRTFVHATSPVNGDRYYFVFKENLDDDAAAAAMIQQQKDEGWFYRDDEVDKPDEERDCARLEIQHIQRTS